MVFQYGCVSLLWFCFYEFTTLVLLPICCLFFVVALSLMVQVPFGPVVALFCGVRLFFPKL